MANQHGFELLPARRQVDVGGIDHGRLAAPVPPARVTGLPLLGRFGIGFVEIGRMVHLDLYDEPIEPRPGRELQVETAARRGTRYAVRQRFAFRRQVKPVGILHAPAMAPVRQRLPAAVSARRQPGLGGPCASSIQTAICGGFFLLIPRNRGKSCSHASPRSTTISTLPFSYSTSSLSQEPSNTNGKIHAITIFLIVFGFQFVTYW